MTDPTSPRFDAAESAIPTPSNPVAKSARVNPFAVLKVLFGYIAPYRALAMGVAAVMVIEVGAALAARLGFKLVIDDALARRDGALLLRLLVLLGVVVLVGSGVGIALDYLTAQLETSVLRDLRQRLFDHMQTLSIAFFARSEVGDLIARFSTDLDSVESALYVCLWSGGASAILTLFAGIPPLFWLDWRLALVAIAGLPLVAIGCARISPKAASAYYETRVSAGKVLAKAQENLSAQPTIKAFGLERAESAAFGVRLGDQFRRSTRSNFFGYLAFRVPDSIGQFTATAVLAFGAWLVLHGSLQVGGLVAFYVMYSQVVRAVRDLTSGIPMLLQSSAGMRRLDELLNSSPDVSDRAGAEVLPVLSRSIAFEAATVRYGANQTPALDRFDLTIHRGTMVALVGPSGAGKTTAVGLLLRFCDPTSGAIRWDSHDLRSVTTTSLRAQIGAVLQDAFLFNTTIRENIRIGRPEATDADVERAARDAEIHDAIAALPRGFDTMVGERGATMSGGERQRVALARALIRNPSVLLLDEPTAALDAASEAAILKTLRRLAGTRTVIASTHRLQAARVADRIVVLDHGRPVEQGTHPSLLAFGGLYATLWYTQHAGSANDRHVEPTGLPIAPASEATA